MDNANAPVLVILVLTCGFILAMIRRARRGLPVFIRRIPGLDAFEEALGRGTEMGRPILFSPGFGSLSTMSTYAGLAVMEHVVRRAAQFGLRVIVPLPDAPLFTVTQARVRDALAAEGRPEMYRPEDILYLSGDQNAFAGAVAGIIERERVAAAFYFGSYGFESLLMAERGQRVGAIQVAATDAFYQVPFFLASCDYTMVGEELYAAGAYLSREPTMTGSLVGQDLGKLLLTALLVIGIASALFASLTGAGAGGFHPFAGLLLR